MSRGGGGGGSTRPSPGRQYIKQEDGTLEEVALEAYGDAGQAPRIWGANARKTTKVRKGEVLIIPGEAPAPKLQGHNPDDLTIIIDGVVIPMQSAKILRAMDTGADGWTGRIAWTPGLDARIDKATRPYGYPRAAAYIGNDLVVNGCLYTVSPEMTDRGMTKELKGYSFTVDMIDSSVLPPYERNNVTLKQLASELCGPFGIKAIFEADFGGKFDRVTAHHTDTVFQHLAKLAAQRGGLVSNTTNGDLLFLRANDQQEPVGTLEETGPFVTGWKAEYDGRKRFYAYKCLTAGVKGRGKTVHHWGSGPVAKGIKREAPTVTEFDKAVPRSRFLAFHADDVTPGNVQNAARWRRNKTFVEALTQPFPVSTWHAPNGKLWAPNTLVTVISPTLGVPAGFTFLIRSVEFEYEEKKRHAVLNLVPPSAYTGKEMPDIWK